MPSLSVRFVRTALVHLVLGALVGSLMLATKGTGSQALTAPLMPVHAELVTVGWMLQLAMGVAFWMLPKHAAEPVRGPEGRMRAAWLLLNAGVVLAALRVWSPALGLPGRLLETAALLAFATAAWPRVKAFGTGRLMESASRG